MKPNSPKISEHVSFSKLSPEYLHEVLRDKLQCLPHSALPPHFVNQNLRFFKNWVSLNPVAVARKGKKLLVVGGVFSYRCAQALDVLGECPEIPVVLVKEENQNILDDLLLETIVFPLAIFNRDAAVTAWVKLYILYRNEEVLEHHLFSQTLERLELSTQDAFRALSGVKKSKLQDLIRKAKGAL